MRQVLAVPPSDLRRRGSGAERDAGHGLCASEDLPGAAVARRMWDTSIRHEAVGMEAAASRQQAGACRRDRPARRCSTARVSGPVAR